MLVELLYPKELKETIVDLKAKNDLNEEALKLLSRQITVMWILWAVLSILFVVGEGADGALVSIALFLIVMLITAYSVRSTFYKQMASYIYGEKSKSTVVKVFYQNLKCPMKVIMIKNGENAQVQKIGPYSIWSKSSGLGPSENDEIYIYQSAEKKFGTVPDNQEIKSIYSLSKSIVSGE